MVSAVEVVWCVLDGDEDAGLEEVVQGVAGEDVNVILVSEEIGAACDGNNVGD